MEQTTRIIIDITREGEPCSLGMKVETIKRIVSVDYKLVYSDRMSARMYFGLNESDPIRNLEMSLLGLEKRQRRKNSRTNTCNFISRFKMIRRKLFGKKV